MLWVKAVQSHHRVGNYLGSQGVLAQVRRTKRPVAQREEENTPTLTPQPLSPPDQVLPFHKLVAHRHHNVFGCKILTWVRHEVFKGGLGGGISMYSKQGSNLYLKAGDLFSYYFFTQNGLKLLPAMPFWPLLNQEEEHQGEGRRLGYFFPCKRPALAGLHWSWDSSWDFSSPPREGTGRRKSNCEPSSELGRA